MNFEVDTRIYMPQRKLVLRDEHFHHDMLRGGHEISGTHKIASSYYIYLYTAKNSYLSR